MYIVKDSGMAVLVQDGPKLAIAKLSAAKYANFLGLEKYEKDQVEFLIEVEHLSYVVVPKMPFKLDRIVRWWRHGSTPECLEKHVIVTDKCVLYSSEDKELALRVKLSGENTEDYIKRLLWDKS